jgi:hypothetical protein
MWAGFYALWMAAAEIAGPGAVQFYDNGDGISTGRPDGDVENHIDVDRVYGIDYDMTDEQWQRL